MFEGLAMEQRCADALRRSVETGRLSHAVILEGGDETVRLAAAKELARAIVCAGEPKPCGVCRACRKAAANSHPDIHLLQKEEGTAYIKVDAVRRLKEQAMLLPNDGDRSVFLIAEAQCMNVQAQNALLKIFEEPAPHVHFILTADSAAGLLETIRSRATSYLLTQAQPTAENEAEEKAASAAAAFLQALCTGSELDVLGASAVFQKDKALLQDALGVMTLLLRDALLCGMNAAALQTDTALAAALHRRFSRQQLLAMKDAADDLLARSRANANQNLTATMLCAAFYKIKLQA